MSSSAKKPLILPLFAGTVRSEWPWRRLDEIADVYDCPHSTPALVENPVAPFVVRSQDVRSGSFLTASAARVSQETYEDRIKRVEPRFGDLVYSREGTYFGIAAEVPRGIKVCLGQRMVLIRPDAERIDHSFLKYWLNSPLVFGHIHGFRDGTVAERLNLPVIRGLPVTLPSVAEQREMAGALAALDERITLLRETNATLEAIAQALFKSWFVDFDPVRAKQLGVAPEGIDDATAALFSDGFDESELGLVPTGWRVGSLGDLAQLHKGTINPLNHPNALFEHYSLPAFDNGQMPVLEAGGKIKSNKTKVPANAVLLSKLNPHIARVWLPANAGQNAVCSTEFLVFVPANGASRDFMYCAFSAPQFQQSLCQLVTGTSNSHQRVRPDGVLTMPAVVPPWDVLACFGSIAKPIFDRVGHNRQQAETLSTLRDTLLPRLISGQLRPPEAANLVLDATA